MTQIKEKRDSVKDLKNSLQDNSPVDSLYSSRNWDMKWDIERENLVLMKH